MAQAWLTRCMSFCHDLCHFGMLWHGKPHHLATYTPKYKLYIYIYPHAWWYFLLRGLAKAHSNPIKHVTFGTLEGSICPQMGCTYPAGYLLAGLDHPFLGDGPTGDQLLGRHVVKRPYIKRKIYWVWPLVTVLPIWTWLNNGRISESTPPKEIHSWKYTILYAS